MPVLRCFFPFSADSSPSGGPKKNFRRDCQCALLWPRNWSKSRHREKKEKSGFSIWTFEATSGSPSLQIWYSKMSDVAHVAGYSSQPDFVLHVFFFTWNTIYIMLGHGFFQLLTSFESLTAFAQLPEEASVFLYKECSLGRFKNNEE